MSRVRAVFLGTPDIAVTCLKSMLADEHFEIVGVVTQPDRPAGRKLILTPSPVKSLAVERGLRVISPDSVNLPDILHEIQSWGAEVAVVVAFGQILSQGFMDLFPHGAVNVHASILPKWRGAAPIQRSLEAGETETGVTLQKVVKKLDAGDIIGIRRFKVDDEMTAQDVYGKMGSLGAELLHVELMDYIRGNLVPEPQDHTLATVAKKITNTEALLSWNDPARLLFNRTRAFVFGPGTWVPFRGKKLKIHRARVAAESLPVFLPDPISGTTPLKPLPGQVLQVDRETLVVACGEGSLSLLEVQPESRNRMVIADFVKSAGLQVGDIFE